MMKTMLFIVSLTIMNSYAHAFECNSKLRNKDLTLNYSSLHEVVTLKYNHQIFEIPVEKQNDGHSGYTLITGKGVAITYSNHYGCIRMVDLVSAIKLTGAPYKIGKISFGTCSGGSTPDYVCQPDNFNN